MPQSTECEIREGNQWRRIGVADVLRDRDATRDRIRCPECKKPVRAHNTGRGGSPRAHFEHLAWNCRCSLRQKGRD